MVRTEQALWCAQVLFEFVCRTSGEVVIRMVTQMTVVLCDRCFPCLIHNPSFTRSPNRILNGTSQAKIQYHWGGGGRRGVG